MRRRFFAKNGQPGAGRRRDGAAGEDVVIEVPPGTVVTSVEDGEVLADLSYVGERQVLLRGGRGGKGNTHFKSSTMQAPRFAQPGEEGIESVLRIEMQIIADVGFVGLPNAGKSTLLATLTAANPKIGNYPFTTVIPNLGVLRYFEHDVVLADIPGIIKGASAGAGLGVRFLKHISRTAGLAFVIDPTADGISVQYEILLRELVDYDPALNQKERIVVVTKHDLLAPVDVDEVVAEVTSLDRSPACLIVSAHSGHGVEELRRGLYQLTERGKEEALIEQDGT